MYPPNGRNPDFVRLTRPAAACRQPPGIILFGQRTKPREQ